MKKAILLMTTLTIGSLLLAQDLIPKKSNAIIITDTLSLLTYYKDISNLLYENGYGILNENRELGIISTTEKSFKNGVLKLNFLIKDNKIILRGDFKIDISLSLGSVSSVPTWSTIQYIGMKNSPSKNAWNEMIKISEAIPGEKEYLIK
jgi:hypothetical protein